MKPTTENIITRNAETGEVIATYDVFTSHLRDPYTDKPKDSKNWQDDNDAWLVIINGQRFDYFTGVGHRKIDLASTWGTKWSGDVKFLIQNRHKLRDDVLVQVSKPVKPDFDAVLACLVQDAVGASQIFEDWCDNYGYETDSRKALLIYMNCQETAKKLRLAKVPLEAEAKRLEDY